MKENKSDVIYDHNFLFLDLTTHLAMHYCGYG